MNKKKKEKETKTDFQLFSKLAKASQDIPANKTSKPKKYIFTGIEWNGERVLAKENCKHCYGRGYVGMVNQKAMGCSCATFTALPIAWIMR